MLNILFFLHYKIKEDCLHNLFLLLRHQLYKYKLLITWEFLTLLNE